MQNKPFVLKTITFATAAIALTSCGNHKTPEPEAGVPIATKELYNFQAKHAPAADRSGSYVGFKGRLPGEIAPPVQNTEQYQEINTNPVHEVAKEPISTFSIDVDTGSYSNVRRHLNSGRLPPQDAVRVEELINYFPYQYQYPKNTARPFGITTETTPSPWNPNAKIIRIGIKASDSTVAALPPANLVFLVDTSGSMTSENKLPLLKKTLRLLTEQMRPQDKITIVTYSGHVELALPATSGKEKDKIMGVIDKLNANGATAGGKAIEIAYEQAQKAYIKNGINRIMLATDGDFNVGISDPKALESMVAEKRKSGISLTTLGFGTGNYNERMMERLADAGDGNYSYIDNEKEARKVLVEQLSSTLNVVAKDVKLQVEFNPNTVSEYRLIGYENRMLKKEDFNNDQVDAGEIGSGHTVTALYEIIPVGKQGWNQPSRYNPPKKQSGYGHEYAFLSIRYKPVGQDTSILIKEPISTQSAPTVQAASEDMRFALAVAAYGQLMRGGQYTGQFSWQDTLNLAKGAKGKDPYGLRGEFIELVGIAGRLATKKPE